MTIKKLSLSLCATALLTTASYATETNPGSLNYAPITSPSATVVKNSLVYATEYLKDKDTSAAPGVPVGITGDNNNVLTYIANIDRDNAVSDANIVLKFSGGAFVGDPAAIRLAEVNATGDVVDIITYHGTENGDGGILFDSDSTKKIVNGKTYRFVNDSNATVSLNVDMNAKATDVKAILEVYSSSGTIDLRDIASTDFMQQKDEYSIVCNSKFDGMINYENSSLTFVSTGHGLPDDNVSDTLQFTISNASGFDYWLNKNISMRVSTGTSDLRVLNSLTSPTNNLNANATDSYITIDTTTIPALGSSAHYTLKVGFDGNTTIPETKFVGEYAGFVGSDISNEVTNYAKGTSTGEWLNYTYVAQIPAATDDGIVQTSIFIVNRGCATVEPTFRVVYNGIVQEVPASAVANLTNFTADGKLAVDAQGKVKVTDIVAAANVANPNIPTTGRYAIEIIIPGLAENFYVYAQAKNTNLNQFKDLPVYNTSTRNY